MSASPSVSASAGIRQLARYEARPEALERCLAAIEAFVAYVRANEPGTLRYEVWRNAAADRAHSESAEVKHFASILYPACLAPVEVVDYAQVATAARP